MLFRFLIIFCLAANHELWAQATNIQQDGIDCNSKLSIAPPYMRDVDLSRAVDLALRAELQKRYLFKCSVPLMVSSDKSKPVFDRLGFSSFFEIDFSALGYKRIEYLIEETGAESFIQAKQTSSRRRLNVYISKFSKDEDDYWQVSAEKFLFTLQMPAPAKKKNIPLIQTRNWLALLTPNSASIGLVNTRVYSKAVPGYYIADENTRGVLPPLISGVGFNKIDHFRAFDLLDLKGSIFPGTFFYGIQQDTTTVRETENPLKDREDERVHTIETYGGCTTLNAMVSAHSPIGTTYGAIGYGPCVYWKKADHQNGKFLLSLASRLLLGQRAFFSEDQYVYVEFDLISLHRKNAFYGNERLHADGVSRVALGLGWYFTNVEEVFSDVFSALF